MKSLVINEGRVMIAIGILLTAMTVFTDCSKPEAEDGTENNTNVNNNTGNNGGTKANEVIMSGSAFTPSTITVTAGTTVKWTNSDGVNHTVTGNTGIFNSGTVVNNGTFSFTFTAAGTFPYHCTLHSGMTGTVVVN